MNAGKNKYYQASIDNVKEVILDVLKNEDVRIILFGSAARGDEHRYSDIDIGILPKNGYKKEKLILLKEKFENMNIPYHVELVDLSLVSAIFKENVLKEGQVWKS
jgi:hypothetical protein